MTDCNSIECWDEAKRLAGLIGLGPSAITSCIRFLVRDESAGCISNVSIACLETLMRSHSIRTCLYFATDTYRKEELANLPEFGHHQMIKLFTPGQIAAMIGLILLYRRIEKGCASTSFIPLGKICQKFALVGGAVGDAIPAIGLANGLLLGALRHLSVAMFLGIDEKGYLKHQRALKLDNRTFDIDTEVALWRTSHAQISSNMIQLLGLGVERAAEFSETYLNISRPLNECPAKLYKHRILLHWLETLYKTGQIPEMAHRGEFYPSQDASEKLFKNLEIINGQEEKASWISIRSSDVEMKQHPLLAQEPKVASSESANVLGEVLSDISREDLNLLEEASK
jgi:hypothetical protein